MIWIINNEESHEIISCNTSYGEDDKGELWITRPNGKNLRVFRGSNYEVRELKEAIDYAIKTGEKTFTIN